MDKWRVINRMSWNTEFTTFLSIFQCSACLVITGVFPMFRPIACTFIIVWRLVFVTQIVARSPLRTSPHPSPRAIFF